MYIYNSTVLSVMNQEHSPIENSSPRLESPSTIVQKLSELACLPTMTCASSAQVQLVDDPKQLLLSLVCRAHIWPLIWPLAHVSVSRPLYYPRQNCHLREDLSSPTPTLITGVITPPRTSGSSAPPYFLSPWSSPTTGRTVPRWTSPSSLIAPSSLIVPQP